MQSQAQMGPPRHCATTFTQEPYGRNVKGASPLHSFVFRFSVRSLLLPEATWQPVETNILVRSAAGITMINLWPLPI